MYVCFSSKKGSREIRTQQVAEGTGPIDALAAALVKALAPTYASVRNVRVTDYKVRILDPSQASRAATRVASHSGAQEETYPKIYIQR